MKKALRFVRIEDIRFPILEYKDNKIDANELVEKLEKLINMTKCHINNKK